MVFQQETNLKGLKMQERWEEENPITCSISEK